VSDTIRAEINLGNTISVAEKPQIIELNYREIAEL
jgi:hypothetical protein